MIPVQIDLIDSDGDTISIWNGRLPELPADGDPIEIRRGEAAGLYRVTGVYWILFGGGISEFSSVIVTVEIDPVV